MRGPAAAVEIRGVSRQFRTPAGGLYAALADIQLSVRAGTFVSLVGPSGCGKSTLLNIIAGLLTADQGTVEISGRPLSGINRRAAYMFQQDALLPWKTVTENIALGLELRGMAAVEARTRAAEWLERVGLQGFGGSYPFQLSGGMRKRAALAQVFITDPDILLMDEPFGALDVHTRQRMESEALALWSGTSKTVIFVTHDLEEAIALSDEVVILSAGPGSHVIGTHSIPLARPRNLIDIRTDPGFAEIYRALWSSLRQEVLRTRV
ncbi:MAG: ABC transporter ATP-binding protein [Bryobacterales bacterium]|nr:ABC transporter ATP-binding protein [Bryobacterales bacterium]